MDSFLKHMSWTKMVKAIETDDVTTVEKYVHVHGIRALTAHLRDEWCETCGHTNITRYALEVAAHAGSLQVFSLLLDYDFTVRSSGQDDEDEDEDEYEDEQTSLYRLYYVLFLACRHGHLEIVRQLLTHCDKNLWVPEIRLTLNYALTYSLQGGNAEIVRVIRDLMLEQNVQFNIAEMAYTAGVRVNILKQSGMTLCEIEAGLEASGCPCPHRIVFLEQDLNRLEQVDDWWKVCDISGQRTVLDLVCSQGSVSVAGDIMQKIPKKSLEFPSRGFHLACEYSHYDMILFLLACDWQESVNWPDVYESGIQTCMFAHKMIPGKLLLGRLLEYKQKARQAIPRETGRTEENEDEEPIIRIETLKKVIEFGTPDVIELVVRSLFITRPTDEFFLRDADVYHTWAAFLLTRKVEVPDSNARANRIATLTRTCWSVCLVTFELLAAECLLEDNLAEAVVFKLFDQLDTSAYWNGSTRTECLQRIVILYRTFQNSPKLRLLLTKFISEIEDVQQLYVLFDIGDFSDVFPRELKTRNDLSIAHSRRDIIRTLQAMCGWRDMVVRCDGLFKKSLSLPESECMEMIDCIRHTGVRVHDALLLDAESSFDSINLPLSQPTNDLVFRWYPQLPLKALCRITIRENLRLACPVGSMDGLLLTLYLEGILPRELVEYLEFKKFPSSLKRVIAL